MTVANMQSAEDVAVELVATKLALAELLDGLTGTTPTAVSNALHDWVWSSPVEFPHAPDAPDQIEHHLALRIFSRSSFIEAEMLEAASVYLADLAKKERAYAEGLEAEAVDGR
jgi:hypothetical protein